MNTETVRDRAAELLDGFNRLHSAIDTLPEHSRKPLRRLAKQAARECENLGLVARQLEDSLADLNLTTAHAQFELHAVRHELRKKYPADGVEG